MELRQDTVIGQLTSTYPFLIEALAAYTPAYAKLRNPLLRNTLGRVASLEKVAHMGKVAPLDLLLFIAREIMAQTGQPVSIIPPAVAEPVPTSQTETGVLSDEERRKRLKDLILSLHNGENVDVLRHQFAETVGDISASEIAALERSLVAEGLPETEIRQLCDLHVEVFKNALDEQKRPDVPAGHPVHTYMAENSHAAFLADDILTQINRIGTPPNGTMWAFADRGLREAFEDLGKIRTHYTRKENQLFPLLEEADMETPTRVMWQVHDSIRALFKKTANQWDRDEPEATAANLRELCAAITDMIYKEERILFPMALETLDHHQWSRVRHGEDEIGYAWVTPGDTWRPLSPDALRLPFKTKHGQGGGDGPQPSEQANATASLVPLSTGALPAEILNLMLSYLPLDMTFVGADDRVAYYSDTTHRIFPRSAAIIGRDVRNCHPADSVHVVEEILARFKSGERDVAEFWIPLHGMFVHIRYFAVRDENKTYLGCLEVSQDLAPLRALEGQRRLLDWS